jgi:hypothetical protein
MKVAQYEVLGNDSERDVRPIRDDRKRSSVVSRIGIHKSKQPLIVPSGTGRPFFNANPALRAGLFSSGPSGTSLS